MKEGIPDSLMSKTESVFQLYNILLKRELGTWDAMFSSAVQAQVSQATCLTFPEIIILLVEKSLEYYWDKTETVTERQQLLCGSYDSEHLWLTNGGIFHFHAA